jgi:hypothetical protein
VYIFTKHSSHSEVRIVAPEDLDGEVERFQPHLVVCNEVTPLVEANVLSWIQILLEDGLNAIVSLDGKTSEVHDISEDDVFAAVDETEKMISQNG